MLNLLFYFCFSSLIVVSLLLWWLAQRRVKRGGRLLEQRCSVDSPLGMIDVIAMFFLWIGGQFIGMQVAIGLLGIGPGGLLAAEGPLLSKATLIVAASQLIVTFFAILLFLIRYRLLSVVGIQPKNLVVDLKLGLVSFVMVIPGILILQWMLVQLFKYEHPTMEMLAENATPLTLVAAWFSAVIVAPICEEIFFRGILQAWLQRGKGGDPERLLIGGWDERESDGGSKRISRKLDLPVLDPTDSSVLAEPAQSSNPYQAPGDVNSKIVSRAPSGGPWPIVISSLLFALVHVGQGPAPVSLFFFGIALGYIYQRTRSIIPCIILHMMLNAFSLFWFTLNVFWEQT
ncbi:MAG: membrane protease YdiL (CAAX protease family) [Mariniblastus sp.]|jgi:membrane protease YdiL (CAAX protease family)